MIEAYAFLAIFTVQIFAVSVLHPVLFSKYLRFKINPAEPDARLYVERRLIQYRVLNTAIAALGLLLLGWLFNYMRRPDWDDGPVEALVGVYFMLQMSPVILVSWIVARINKTLTRSVPKRKASLQRRGLFDFVSPSIIFLAAFAYVFFALLVIHIAQDPFPGFAGPLINIGVVTMLYAFVAFGVYVTLYRTARNPLETHAERMRAIGLGVKIAIYTCIVSVISVSLNMTLVMLELQRWEPFALSVFFVTCGLLYFMGLNARSRLPEADGLGSHGVT